MNHSDLDMVTELSLKLPFRPSQPNAHTHLLRCGVPEPHRHPKEEGKKGMKRRQKREEEAHILCSEKGGKRRQKWSGASSSL